MKKYNHYYWRLILILLSCLIAEKTFAYDIAVENDEGVTIYYIYINDGTELAVAPKSDSNSGYYGTVVIPSEVIYKNRTYKVTKISDTAFRWSGITSVTIPNTVTEIGHSAFFLCSGITSIIIPNSVTYIDNFAFGACKNLTTIILPNSLTHIYYQVFKDCESLSSIIIPDNVVSIGKSAFEGCTNLTNINFPNSITYIGERAFYGCSSLSDVTLPNSITTINDDAFRGCGNIVNVISKMEVPCSINSSCFNVDVYYDATLYVPQGTIDKYIATDYWNKFDNIVEDNPTGINHIEFGEMTIIPNDGIVNVSGIDDGMQIAIYQTDGKQVATAKAYNGSANVATNISKGNTVIVKIGDKAVKVMMK